MKRFNLEKAKAGDPVCTRGGYKARIICFDAKALDYPVIALVEKDNKYEEICTYAESGEYNIDRERNSDMDLMMAPVKKEGWISIYEHSDGPKRSGGYIYPTKEEAIKRATGPILATVKIEWEE